MSIGHEIVSRIRDHLVCSLDRMIEEAVRDFIDPCESPIELMFLVSLVCAVHMGSFRRPRPVLIVGKPTQVFQPHVRFFVIPQYKISNYRIDFAFFHQGQDIPALFVECDGHDFHERTKEQAERDRQKDRFLQSTGAPIFRFTGSEIYRDSESCALQVFQFLLDRIPAKTDLVENTGAEAG